MRKMILGMALLGMAAPALAAPVSLKCTMAGTKGDILFNLFEAEGKATYSLTMADGNLSTQTKPAQFTPELVTVISMKDSIASISWRINRITLGLERVLGMSGSPDTIDKGQCQLYKPPKAAF